VGVLTLGASQESPGAMPGNQKLFVYIQRIEGQAEALIQLGMTEKISLNGAEARGGYHVPSGKTDSLRPVD